MKSMKKKLNYKVNLKNIKLFVFDVDGVLSDGMVMIDRDMSRNYNTKDSLALRLAVKSKLDFIVISAGTSQKVKERYEFLGAKKVVMNAFSKLDILETYLTEHNIDWEEVLYMGDDLPDYECLTKVGVATCPRNAVVEIREIVDYVSHFDGGNGAVRDVVQQTLMLQGKWPNLKQNPRIEF